MEHRKIREKTGTVLYRDHVSKLFDIKVTLKPLKPKARVREKKTSGGHV